MLSAISFNLDQSKSLSSGNELPTLLKKSFENIVGNGESSDNHHFLHFQEYLSPQWRRIAALKLSANSFHLDKAIILSSCKGLTLYQTTNFRLFHTERICI